MSILHAGSHRLSLKRPLVMGIVNVTPDSFSDGGTLDDAQSAIDHALKLHDEGADILDVGGESTRPGASPVLADDEVRRILPVIEALAARGVVVSADTRKPEVMQRALEAGASMINDVTALASPGAIEVLKKSSVAVCLMHMQGEPQTMQQAPHYEDVVGEVGFFLAGRIEACVEAGIARNRIVIDPGFGFGKTLVHNLNLLRHLDQIAALGVPVLAGLSRKSLLGVLTGREVGRREYAGVAAHLIAVARGAKIVRVHDVAAMRDALAIWNAVEGIHDGT